MKIDESDMEEYREMLLREGFRILRDIKKNCPVDSGRLRASYTLVTDEGVVQGPGPEALSGDGIEPSSIPFSVVIGTNVEYAQFVEFGTGKMDAQPHVRPAVDAFKQRIGAE